MPVFEEIVEPTYVDGNLLWLRLDVDSTQMMGLPTKNLLIHKWVLAAEFILRNHPSLSLTWPSIIEYEVDGKWAIELKAVIEKNPYTKKEQE